MSSAPRTTLPACTCGVCTVCVIADVEADRFVRDTDRALVALDRALADAFASPLNEPEGSPVFVEKRTPDEGRHNRGATSGSLSGENVYPIRKES